MVIVQLKGGLGNQMFQYAIGRRMADYHNTILAIDNTYYEKQKEYVTPRKYELDCFSFSKRIATRDEISRIKSSRPGFLDDIFKHVIPRACNVYKERNQNFDKQVFLTSTNVYLKGYWQSEKYFHDIESIIRGDFTFIESPLDDALKVVNEIQKNNSLSIHFRRTDYIGKDVEKICTLKYYKNAIEYISSHITDLQIYLFSDDINWVKENIRFDFPTTYIDEKYTQGKGWRDMQLMRMCKHNITANSSFSWWAAWLNANPQKIVVTPTKWNFLKDINAIVPENWIKIKSI